MDPKLKKLIAQLQEKKFKIVQNFQPNVNGEFVGKVMNPNGEIMEVKMSKDGFNYEFKMINNANREAQKLMFIETELEDRLESLSKINLGKKILAAGVLAAAASDAQNAEKIKKAVVAGGMATLGLSQKLAQQREVLRRAAFQKLIYHPKTGVRAIELKRSLAQPPKLDKIRTESVSQQPQQSSGSSQSSQSPQQPGQNQPQNQAQNQPPLFQTTNPANQPKEQPAQKRQKEESSGFLKWAGIIGTGGGALGLVSGTGILSALFG